MSPKRLGFESLEDRRVLSGLPVAQLPEVVFEPAHVAPIDEGPSALLAPDSIVPTLKYNDFHLLTAAQVPLLTLQQVASIPNIGWFGQMSAQARAALSPAQVQSLNVRDCRITLLSAEQVGWLSIAQLRSLYYYDFQDLQSDQIRWLTPAQIASIPDSGPFGQISAATRAALTQSQVQAIDVAKVKIELLTPQQRSWLTAAQVQSLPYYQFHFLPPSHTPLLTPAQVATIDDTGPFSLWSAAARAALTPFQVQALNTSEVMLSLLTPQQVAWLTAAQVRSLPHTQFSYLPATLTPYLTPAQIASIPDSGPFGAISSVARAALTASQVQALNAAKVKIDLLTPQQVSWLTPGQVRVLPYHQFGRLPATHTPYLTPAQIASIPDSGPFGAISDEARAALTNAQVQALNVAKVKIELLTPMQTLALTPAQIGVLPHHQFKYLQQGQIPLLSVAQVASIPSVGSFAAWSRLSRIVLSEEQIQSLQQAVLRLNLIAEEQIRLLTPTQVQALSWDQFRRLHPSQIPLLTTAQIASVPDNYNFRLWSDEQVAALTRSQFLAMSHKIYTQFNGLDPAFLPPANYQPVASGHNHHSLDAPNAEATAVFNLVPIASATHRTIASGNWSNPQIWSGGVVPGANARVVISEGSTVRFDAFMNTAISTLRIDGKLEFATNASTQLKVDTVVVTTHGVLHIGTEAAPIADNVVARVLIADNGPINTAWDPYLWSRGLVSRGEVRMQGRAVTPYATLPTSLNAGATQLTFTQPLAGWRVGDELVISGTNAYTPSFNADRVRIRAISGSVVTVDPLKYRHDLPPGQGLSLYVANLNRNVQFVAEDSSVSIERPHIALMHNPDVVIANIGIYGFGRTDKRLPINSSVVSNGVLQTGTGTNPRARYALHFHHMGVDPTVNPAVVAGSVVDGSPGWGFVNHSSNVTMSNNVAFGVLGASFVTEDGNEIGTMRDNLAMNTLGADTGDTILTRQNSHDFGHEGVGFWFQGPGVKVIDNVSAGSQDGGFVYLTQSSKTLFDAVNLKNPMMGAGQVAIRIGEAPLDTFSGNTAFSAESGLEIWHHKMLMSDGLSVISNFTSWNTIKQGVDLHYSSHILFDNARLIGDTTNFTGTGIAANRVTHDITIRNLTAVGFEVGVVVPVRRKSVIIGGNIVAARGLYIEKGHDTIREVTIEGLNMSSPSAAQLKGRTYFDIYATGEFAFEYPYFLDRRLDSLFSEDRVRVSINGAAPGRLFYYEQAADYVPFPLETAEYDVPGAYRGKTNFQLARNLGVSFGGRIASPAVTVPRIFGLVAYGL